MKKRNRQTSATLSVTILLLTAVITSAEQTAAAGAAASLEATSTAEPIVRGTIVETQAETQKEQAEENIIEETAIYTGLADPHTAEFKIDGEAAAFQLEEGLMEQLAHWRSGTQVELRYTIKTFDNLPDVRQLVLHEVEMTDKKNDE